jgi:hypothetical protein
MRLIEIYWRRGRFDRATDLARQLAERYPDEVVFQEQLEQLEQAGGDTW